MIRTLRWRLVAITSVLLALMLGLILSIVCQATWTGLYQDSLDTMEEVVAQLSGHGKRPGLPDRVRMTDQCFVLWQGPDGIMRALGPDRYISDEQKLEQLLEEAQETDRRTGELDGQHLRFLRVDDGPHDSYVFMDIALEEQTLSRLMTSCAALFVVGTLCFFFFSVALARRATRPVEQAWEQQRQFVSDASHELKTPLTVILTNAELLADPDQPQQTKDRCAGSILTMSRQMRGLVEELLDQARVDNGTIRAGYAPLDMSKLVSDAMLPFEPVYYEAGRTLQSQIQPDIRLTGSADRLRQVTEILLDNGHKYSTPGGTVLLRLIRQDRSCLLSVTTPGEALTAQQCQDIFKRFYRVDTARKMDHSYGLGLSIAKGIVEQHNGSIWAQSQDGYNTFFVRLPL